MLHTPAATQPSVQTSAQWMPHTSAAYTTTPTDQASQP